MTDTQAPSLATNPDHSKIQKANTEISTSHLEEFEVGKYRGIGKLSMKNVAKMNLIVGKNASGKTSLLEAIWLFYNRRNPRTLWHVDLSRSGYAYTDPIAELGREGEISMNGIQGGSRHSYLATFQTFHTRHYARRQKTLNPNSDELQVVGKLRVQLDAKDIGAESVETLHTRDGLVRLPTLNRKVPSPLLLPNSFLSRNSIRFSRIIKRSQKKSLMRQLRLILPLLKDVDIIVESDGDPYILGTTEAGESRKLEDMGGGMVRLFDCLVALYTSRNGIVCMDEIESGLHHTLLPKFLGSMRLLSEELNVQIFAATHSRECINAAIEAYKDRPTDIRIYAMYHNNDEGHIKSVSYSGDELDAINSMNIEVR